MTTVNRLFGPQFITSNTASRFPVVVHNPPRGSALIEVVIERIRGTPLRAEPFSELRVRETPALVDDVRVVPLVARVDRARNETDVAWLVVPFVVPAVHVEPWLIPVRQRNGVAQKRRPVVEPLRTHADAPAAIIFVRSTTRVVTPADDAGVPVRPDRTNRVVRHDSGFRVRSVEARSRCFVAALPAIRLVKELAVRQLAFRAAVAPKPRLASLAEPGAKNDEGAEALPHARDESKDWSSKRVAVFHDVPS